MLRPARILLLAHAGVLVFGCARLGDLGPSNAGVLASDSASLPKGDPGAQGPLAVDALGLEIDDPWGAASGLIVAIYKPLGVVTRAPAVVFLPGRAAPESQYESYARALASRGFVVAVRGWYSPLRTDPELAHDACAIGDWLVNIGLADPRRLGIAGHSMGGKDAILAALQEPRFRAVVALDPDDNGEPSVASHQVHALNGALLLIGAEVGWKGASVCAPLDRNYQRFFEHAPTGTIELTLRDADHVQVMDDPDAFGLGICRAGTADSTRVRMLARGALVSFFAEHLLGERAPSYAGVSGISVRTQGEVDALTQAKR